MRWSAVVVLAASAPALWGGCGRLGYETEALTAAGDAGMDGARPPKPDGSTGGPDGTEDAVCGDGDVSGTELCDDGNTTDGDGCSADCTTRELCGDGVVTAGEACDDGNSDDGDGCGNDCRPSCELDSECDDGRVCNGEETCSGGACVAGAAQPDGTSCGANASCRAGSCAPTTCGDGLVDTGESCDDANTTEGDGCDNDCTFSCADVADCDDGNACDGLESCDTALRTCVDATPPASGTLCDRDANPDTRDICLRSTCVASRCGDAFRDDGEQCDDGNTTNADGCDNDCTFSCTESTECDDGLVCNGTETCTSNRCAAGAPPPDGTSCPLGTCMGGVCASLGIDGGVIGGGMCGSTTCGSRQRCCCNSCVSLGVECLDVKCPPAS